jgi:hypothetical protein
MDSKEPKEKHVICKYLSEFKQMRVTLNSIDNNANY